MNSTVDTGRHSIKSFLICAIGLLPFLPPALTLLWWILICNFPIVRFNFLFLVVQFEELACGGDVTSFRLEAEKQDINVRIG